MVLLDNGFRYSLNKPSSCQSVNINTFPGALRYRTNQKQTNKQTKPDGIRQRAVPRSYPLLFPLISGQGRNQRILVVTLSGCLRAAADAVRAPHRELPSANHVSRPAARGGGGRESATANGPSSRADHILRAVEPRHLAEQGSWTSNRAAESNNHTNYLPLGVVSFFI